MTKWICNKHITHNSVGRHKLKPFRVPPCEVLRWGRPTTCWWDFSSCLGISIYLSIIYLSSIHSGGFKSKNPKTNYCSYCHVSVFTVSLCSVYMLMTFILHLFVFLGVSSKMYHQWFQQVLVPAALLVLTFPEDKSEPWTIYWWILLC